MLQYEKKERGVYNYVVRFTKAHSPNNHFELSNEVYLLLLRSEVGRSLFQCVLYK